MKIIVFFPFGVINESETAVDSTHFTWTSKVISKSMTFCHFVQFPILIGFLENINLTTTKIM